MLHVFIHCTSIQSLPIEERSPIRYLVAKSLDNLPHKHPHITNANEHKTLQNLRDKLIQNKCMITKAGKGQNLIVITKEAYESKIYDFLQDNNFVQISRDPTAFYTRETKKILNTRKLLIPHHSKWKYSNMNPHQSNIRGLLKIHKPEAPKRRVVSWQKSPAYKLSKLLSDRLQQELQLPYTFNIKNYIHLMSEISNIAAQNSNTRMASFDISNTYTIIPTSKIPAIITEISNNLTIHKSVRIEHNKLT